MRLGCAVTLTVWGFFPDNVDSSEAKGLFEANFSHIYHILYDSFIQAETNLRQRGESFFFNYFVVWGLAICVLLFSRAFCIDAQELAIRCWCYVTTVYIRLVGILYRVIQIGVHTWRSQKQ